LQWVRISRGVADHPAARPATKHPTVWQFVDGRRQIEHCAFDSYSYRNPNGNAQEYGRWALRSSGAVVLIPRVPLTPGAEYSVSITAHGSTYAWKFKIAG
jgi:hypothetical protein